VNRIKKLNKKSFSSYTNLKILYLQNNKIAKIETGTFAVLTDLRTLDLSDNSFREVLPEILDLPNLNKLSVAEIELKNDGFHKIRKPIKAPLMVLNIAETDIDQIPDFGILPSLKELNISFNTLTHIKAEQFAPLCRIETVDINETEISACDCSKINFFIENELQRSPLLKCEKTPKSKFFNFKNFMIT
jgi:insulin-like growth factor-binding protein complex acid labile subunit